MNTKVAKKNNKGFTLIELIVVIAIIAVLAAILAPQYLRYVEKSRVTSDESTAKEINNAVQTACADSNIFENVTNSSSVTWAKNGTISGTATDVVTELNNNTFPNGAPAMKSKVWQQHEPYTVSITVSGDVVKISDNAPTVSGKTKTTK